MGFEYREVLGSFKMLLVLGRKWIGDRVFVGWGFLGIWILGLKGFWRDVRG